MPKGVNEKINTLSHCSIELEQDFRKLCNIISQLLEKVEEIETRLKKLEIEVKNNV